VPTWPRRSLFPRITIDPEPGISILNLKPREFREACAQFATVSCDHINPLDFVIADRIQVIVCEVGVLQIGRLENACFPEVLDIVQEQLDLVSCHQLLPRA
jgi:hypothetical protein